MASLDDVISAIFSVSSAYSHINRLTYGNPILSAPVTSKKYMEIPISSDVFELPLLAFEGFREMNLKRSESDMIVANLYSCGQTSSYKSFDSIIKDVLSTRFNRCLCKIQVAGTNNIYYATFGAVFDDTFKPLMMLSWVMERKADGEGVIKYHYKRPLLRLNPYPCINKEDALQRFLASRMLTTTLGTAIHIPYFYDCNSFIEQSQALLVRDDYRVKVEIDECPFIIKGTDTPSISVTNKSLLQLVADHIDEVLQ